VVLSLHILRFRFGGFGSGRGLPGNTLLNLPPRSEMYTRARVGMTLWKGAGFSSRLSLK
jgi:hypothetical protein